MDAYITLTFTSPLLFEKLVYYWNKVQCMLSFNPWKFPSRSRTIQMLLIIDLIACLIIYQRLSNLRFNIQYTLVVNDLNFQIFGSCWFIRLLLTQQLYSWCRIHIRKSRNVSWCYKKCISGNRGRISFFG